MGRRNRLPSYAIAPEPTAEEKLQYLNNAIEAIKDDQVNKLVTTMPLGVDIKGVYTFGLVKSKNPNKTMSASLLHLSILNKSNDCTKFLLHLGAPKEAPESSLGDRPLHSAVRLGYKEAIDWLLEYGVQPTTFNNVGDTPLHIAASKGDIHTVKALLDEGADSRAKNRNNQTPRCLAILSGSPKALLCAHIIAASETQEMSSYL